MLRLGILLIAFAGLAISGERAFNGALEALTNGQIRLRLSDGRRVCVRLENTGPLSAQAILNSYRLGDRLEAVIDDGHAIFDNESGWEFPALKDLRFMRPADPDELPSFHMHRPWWIDHNLLPGAPSRGLPDVPAETASETPLERARRVNLDYMAKLPNFVADEKARRTVGASVNSRSSIWRPLDTVESEISFRQVVTHRQNVRVNGKPWNEPNLPYFQWATGFGELRPLFDTACPVTFENPRKTKVNGKAALEFRFQAPVDSCFTPWVVGGFQYNAARRGRVVVDETTSNALLFEEEIQDMPAPFDFQSEKESVTWGEVKIGEANHLLPVAYESTLWSKSGAVRVAVEYKNHRHFETASSITFQ